MLFCQHINLFPHGLLDAHVTDQGWGLGAVLLEFIQRPEIFILNPANNTTLCCKALGSFPLWELSSLWETSKASSIPTGIWLKATGFIYLPRYREPEAVMGTELVQLAVINSCFMRPSHLTAGSVASQPRVFRGNGSISPPLHVWQRSWRR